MTMDNDELRAMININKQLYADAVAEISHAINVRPTISELLDDYYLAFDGLGQDVTDEKIRAAQKAEAAIIAQGLAMATMQGQIEMLERLLMFQREENNELRARLEQPEQEADEEV